MNKAFSLQNANYLAARKKDERLFESPIANGVTMALYRKGDRILSEAEYRKEQEQTWDGFLFVVGAITVGYMAYQFIDGHGFAKWLRFSIIILAGVIGGMALARLRVQIQKILYISLFLGILYVLGSLLWRYI